MPNAQAEAIKAVGNTHFKAGEYAKAIEQYVEATKLDPSVPAYWSNMAACHEKLSQFAEMEEAAKSCIKADKSFVKGYFRLAVAQDKSGKLEECIKTLESGLAVDSSNADLKKMKAAITETRRNKQVEQYVQQAKDLLEKNDVPGAYKAVELASRMDAGSSLVQAMQKRVSPLFEKHEQQRKASLSGPELDKEAGDASYKNAQFEEAITKYTKCLDKLTDKSSQLALKALANRAACYKQISNYDGTIEDCTAVLEVEPDNVKALIRRAQAFEGVERYRFALQDVKSVLQLPSAHVGKQNWDMCNGMQHRLSRTVAALKKASSS